jgi:phosphatidylglycerophosphate synthase
MRTTLLCLDAERRQAARHPISRWYVRPAAGWLAAALAPSRVRPAHLTICGLLAATVAAAVLVLRPDAAPVAAAMVLAAWFFDRADGLLARRQRTASAWGAWLDANVDELVDVGLQVAVAAAAATLAGSTLPWALLVAFLVGKYLLVCSLALEEPSAEGRQRSCDGDAPSGGWLRRAYHLPGNADVRVHLLVLALVTGWLTAELALVAAYYNLRWIARYVLVFRRLGGNP